MTTEPIAVTLLVIEALDDLGVRYVIGGSLASALHGVARATMDADLVADLKPQHVRPLVQKLAGAFYIDEDAVRTAVASRRSFNAIHLAAMFKVDVFIPKGRPFDLAQLDHATAQLVATGPDRLAYVASAEDTILAKLDWYRQGGEVSERQWRDVLGVVKVQGDRLDWTYLRQQAANLGLSDLLEKLQSAAS
ncbi:MAG: hypothetical protein V9H69_17585 [Anaerolineae bacterium]